MPGSFPFSFSFFSFYKVFWFKSKKHTHKTRSIWSHLQVIVNLYSKYHIIPVPLGFFMDNL